MLPVQGGSKWQSWDDIHPCDMWEAALWPPQPSPHRAVAHNSHDATAAAGTSLCALHTDLKGLLLQETLEDTDAGKGSKDLNTWEIGPIRRTTAKATAARQLLGHTQTHPQCLLCALLVGTRVPWSIQKGREAGPHMEAGGNHSNGG